MITEMEVEMIIDLVDNTRLGAKAPNRIVASKDIVRQLNLMQYTSFDKKRDYMSKTKERIDVIFGQEIAYSNAFEFLEELQRIGFIKKMEVKRNAKDVG